MTTEYLDYRLIDQIAPFDLAYLEGRPEIRSFYHYDFEQSAFDEILQNSAKIEVDRELLKSVLKDQYQAIENAEIPLKNIDLLTQPNTYCVTTAHQPVLMTGPLYTIYKIISAINLSRKLNDQYTDKHFVPIFWMGGEDHDFEEMNHCNIFGKRIQWNDFQGGAVGRYNLNKINEVFDQLDQFSFNLDSTRTMIKIFRSFSEKYKRYSDFFRAVLNHLFHNYGLIVIDPDHVALKKKFIPIIEDELFQQSAIKLLPPFIDKKSQEGFQPQAHVRAINVFYLENGIRNRIVFEKGKYLILNTDLSFDKAQLLDELNAHPEKFSPNVVLRPLYQESILPNIAFVGGGGELAYWMERKPLFEHYNVHFPMLVRRASVLFFEEQLLTKFQSLGFSALDIFKDLSVLEKEFVQRNEMEESIFNEYQLAFNSIHEKLKAAIESRDKGLLNALEAIQQQHRSALEKFEKKLMKSLKSKYDSDLAKIRKIKNKLFPSGGLQERTENFISFYDRYGSEFFDHLFQSIDPMNKKFMLIS